MASRRERPAWLAVGLAQILLLCAAAVSVAAQATLRAPAGRPLVRTVRGYPVPWLEEQGLRAGRNPVVPLAAAVLAFGIPPAVAAARRRSWTRYARLCGAAALAGFAALSLAWLESETWDWFGQTPFAAHPPGSWVSGTQFYGQFQDALVGGRGWVTRNGPGWLPPESWAVRRLLTLTALLAGAAVGCGLFRPWQREASTTDEPSRPTRRTPPSGGPTRTSGGRSG